MKIKDTLENYVFVLPAVAIFSIFYIIPFIWVFQLGLFEWDGISFTRIFVGLDNFKEIFLQDVNWWRAMWNAGYITLIALLFQNILAFMLAWACDRQIRLKNFYRVIFFIPPVLSEIVVGMIWRFIINDIEGANIINRMLASIGFPNLMHQWLSDPKTVLTTVAAVHCWKGFGWGFLIFLAGLQTIPHQLYESARVDGANAWQSFKKITVPLMIPVTVLVAILTVLGSMQAFALILGLVGGEFAGHTSVPVLRILASMRGSSSRFGYACAQGISLGMILVTISFIQYRFSKKGQ
ncbi:MAG: sugar ABC transporter permease [Candidatus Omnitrophica bacterium]|nr:sugar ABC transporter permease [Candidatus Omnitrophota bacterium]MBU4303259.1 sugar ABC transporter permease [Candidatus Omnitrophota bacterium]MBU4418298.1 sugar ABC transporter permease [Candidatus Omnitrophota bacterium]MBU4468367.1 sugar ABC transporter permease [Candidatus Omnitrophota bacterium]MCG2708208.1 sugar ABC transporter permease [Candidatus Omnitrophota bacterium]